MAEGIVAVVLVVGVIAMFYACGWADGRDAERAKLKAQMRALQASLRLADAAWDARQELRQASIEAARQTGEHQRRSGA